MEHPYTKESIRDSLLSMCEKEYQKFSSSLVPGCEPMLGVRLPDLRKLAKRIALKDGRYYLANETSEELYEEIMLQGMVIGYGMYPIKESLSYAAEFIPKIHNWAVNDSFCSSFKIAGKYPEEVWEFLMGYLSSNEEYPLRVVAVMLMNYFLSETYIDRVLEVLSQIRHDGYYAKMGTAWALATAYAKFPDKTMALLKKKELEEWVYRKAIQKMLESNRVCGQDKELLRKMRNY